MITTIVALAIWAAAAFALCWANHRLHRRTKAQPEQSDADWLAAWPTDSPLYLTGVELDARFYSVVADGLR